MPGIDVSMLPDGVLTYSVTLTDKAGNAGTAATAQVNMDKTPPTGYSITPNDGYINAGEATTTSFKIVNAEVGATYSYSIVSSGGTATVTGMGTIGSVNQQVTNVDVSSLLDGTLTYSVTLTDASHNAGGVVTATAILDRLALLVTRSRSIKARLQQPTIRRSASPSRMRKSADTYTYTVTSDNGTASVTNTGTVTSANQQVTNIDVSTLASGTLTFSVKLTDKADNVGAAAIDERCCNSFQSQFDRDAAHTMCCIKRVVAWPNRPTRPPWHEYTWFEKQGLRRLFDRYLTLQHSRKPPDTMSMSGGVGRRQGNPASYPIAPAAADFLTLHPKRGKVSVELCRLFRR